jgi:hypothetical protein
MHYKKYNLIILIPLGLLIFAILGFAYVLQPMNGALTRIGGYSENEFGWNRPQERLKSKLYPTGKQGAYDKYYDVVVVGDSFTNHTRNEAMHPAGYWPNYFANATGLDLIAFNLIDTTIKKLIESDGFKKFPPSVLIFEIVERDLIWTLSRVRGDCTPKKNPKIRPMKIKPIRDPLLQFERNTNTGFSNLKLGISANFLKKQIFRSSNVVLMPLDREGLFSNKSNKGALVWGGDFLNYSYNEAKINKAVCGLLNLQNIVQSNDKTLFVAMIAPDKLSTYSNYFKSFRGKGKVILDYFAKKPINFPRVDVALKKGIEKGVVDIYLPNDTHWGSWGHKTAAQTVVKYLEKQGIFIN